MTLTIRNETPTNIFRLYGFDENSATYAVGWVLEKSPRFLDALIEAVFGERLEIDDAVIALQKHSTDGGYTDIEVHAGGRFHLIFEAKRWSELPSLEQLSRYRPRLEARGAKRQRLVCVSAADEAYAARKLPEQLDSVPVSHLSWRDFQKLAEKAHKQTAKYEEKLWLRQLSEHLGEYLPMERQNDNQVYVVSLNSEPMVEGQEHTWIDVVEKDRSYFHPFEKGWPDKPPNYVGFRYHGKLQSVHHVDSFAVVENLADCNTLWPAIDSDHFVYSLGPPMYPEKEIRTGRIYRNGRVWCAIDTLLSGAFATISDARDETQRRAG